MRKDAQESPSKFLPPFPAHTYSTFKEYFRKYISQERGIKRNKFTDNSNNVFNSQYPKTESSTGTIIILIKIYRETQMEKFEACVLHFIEWIICSWNALVSGIWFRSLKGGNRNSNRWRQALPLADSCWSWLYAKLALHSCTLNKSVHTHIFIQSQHIMNKTVLGPCI